MSRSNALKTVKNALNFGRRKSAEDEQALFASGQETESAGEASEEETAGFNTEEEDDVTDRRGKR